MEQHKQEELDFLKNRIELLYKIVKILLSKNKTSGNFLAEKPLEEFNNQELTELEFQLK